MAAAEDVYSTATANREEATRAKEIALQKLQQKDWQSAKRLFLKAQRLCADLEGVANCIVVAEVHIIAEATLQTTPYREMIRDYYAILDVSHDVSKKDLVQQYKKRAFQLHPDKNQYPGAEAAFKLLGEAFAVLKDDDKRRKHDIQRHHRLNVQNGARFSGGQSQPHPRQPGVPPQARGPFAQPFGGGSWLPNFFSGGTAGAGYPQGARPPPQRPAAAGVPRDSSGSTFAGYSVNEQGGPVYPGRVPVAANQPGGSTQFAHRPAQWAGAQPGNFAPQTPGGSFQPGRASAQPGSQPGASAGTHAARAGQGSQPGMPVNQPGMYNARPGVPFTRPMPQQGIPVHPPGTFAGQPGPSSDHQRPFPAQASAPHSQPNGPTGPPQRPTGPFPTQPSAPQPHMGVYPGAASGMQPGGQYRPGMPPPGRYTALCSFCSQRYTFPLDAKDKWVRCQRCKAAFKATEDRSGVLPGVVPGGVPGVATGVPAGAVPAHPSPTGAGAFAGTAGGRASAFGATAGGSAGASAGPSAATGAPLTRVQQAWDEAVKIRTDRKKEVKREARQQKKDEKKQREIELERLRALREEAKQAKAEEKARRQQSRDKADAESRAKVTAEDEQIPLRSSSKPINVDSVNGESANVGNVNGLPNGLGSDAEDEPLILRRKGKLQKVGDMQGVVLGEGVKEAESGVKAAGLRVNGVEKGGESQDLENDPGLRKRKGTEDGSKGGADEEGPEGTSKENEGSQRDGLAAGTANGSDDRRKRRRVSYIELSDGEEDSETDGDVAKRRADKGKAKVGDPENGLGNGKGTGEDVSVTWEELKQRTGLGEGSTAAIEGDPPGEGSTVDIQDDPLGEVLPGRTKKRERSLAKLLSVKNSFKPGDDLPGSSMERPFLLPARSLRRLGTNENPPLLTDRKPPSDDKPASVKMPVSETATGGVNPSPGQEAGPSEAAERQPVEPTGESAGSPGGDSNQAADEAGPSNENGHPPEEGEDTIFFDFDEARKETDVRKGEFWALYDDQDSMPRFYARVDTVSLDPFQGTLTWFEAAEQTRESFAARLPSLAARFVSPGVGKFVYGTTSDFVSINTFAYRQTALEETPCGGVKLAPRCGEVWALFRPEKGSKRGKDGGRIGYNMVLIARADGGFAVTRLVKIPGYKSLFQPVQDAAGEHQQVPVKLSDVPLFSHRVLAKKVPPHLIAYNGPARNVEVWELDLAALPPDDDA